MSAYFEEIKDQSAHHSLNGPQVNDLIHVLNLFEEEFGLDTSIPCKVSIEDYISPFTGFGPVNFFQLLCHQINKKFVRHFFSDKLFSLAYMANSEAISDFWSAYLERESEAFQEKNEGIIRFMKEKVTKSLGVDPDLMLDYQHVEAIKAGKVIKLLDVEKKHKRMEKNKEKQAKTKKEAVKEPKVQTRRNK